MAPRGQPLIVVGVDGAASSKEALRWAARQAQLTGAELRVVTAWRLPVTYGYAPDYSGAGYQDRARETLDDAMRFPRCAGVAD
ncbi:universal stress protein [Streptomyces sp. NPDC048279]|uniref:universal stress protein n=1 Tax=Streptomyces sp. NPDC048279 TaxID=3154714 RepID=UPI0034239E48